MAMTSSPSSVSSCAMIEPVQPSPTITTSFFGRMRAMRVSPFRRPVRAAHHAHGRQRIALVVAVDPVQIVVTGAGKPDHLPRNHVAVAAVDRVGEEAGFDVDDDPLEKRSAVDAIELDLFAFKAFEHLVLDVVAQIREGLAVLRAAVAIECASPSRYVLAGPPAAC